MFQAIIEKSTSEVLLDESAYQQAQQQLPFVLSPEAHQFFKEVGGRSMDWASHISVDDTQESISYTMTFGAEGSDDEFSVIGALRETGDNAIPAGFVPIALTDAGEFFVIDDSDNVWFIPLFGFEDDPPVFIADSLAAFCQNIHWGERYATGEISRYELLSKNIEATGAGGFRTLIRLELDKLLAGEPIEIIKPLIEKWDMLHQDKMSNDERANNVSKALTDVWHSSVDGQRQKIVEAQKIIDGPSY